MQLTGIATRPAKDAAMKTVDKAHIDKQTGLFGDYRNRPGKRQVTVMSQKDWHQACKELAIDLPWTTRRANLLVDNYQFSAADVGRIIAIGNVRLLIRMETDPCHKMDEQYQGLKAALQPDWRGGVCCEVLQSGEIQNGDSVQIIDKDPVRV